MKSCITCQAEYWLQSLCCPIGTRKPKMATHVLQFMFLGDTGFRWPCGHFPTMEATAAELYTMFWDGVQALKLWGFTVSVILG